MTTRRPTEAFGPYSLSTYRNLKRLMGELELWLTSPFAPPPDLTLLEGGGRTEHETYTMVEEAGMDSLFIAGVPPGDVPPDYPLPLYRPEEILMLRIMQLYGGIHGFNQTNPNCPTHHHTLYSNNRRSRVNRLIVDALSTDHVRVDGLGELYKVSIDYVRNAEGKEASTPSNAREQAIEAGLWYHRRNHGRTDIKLTARGYRRLMERAFRLLGLVRARRAERRRQYDNFMPLPEWSLEPIPRRLLPAHLTRTTI